MSNWLEKAAPVRVAMDMAGLMLTDEQAVIVAPIYRAWEAGGVYEVDDRRLYMGVLYRCLQELVDAEDKSNPLTDTELMDKLKEQGFTMARRTVAKYREQLHIPVARLRKE